MVQNLIFSKHLLILIVLTSAVIAILLCISGRTAMIPLNLIRTYMYTHSNIGTGAGQWPTHNIYMKGLDDADVQHVEHTKVNITSPIRESSQ